MITNGILLESFATDLREAGLDRVTVSLHTLNDARFTTSISNQRSRRNINEQTSGIRAAIAAGLSPVKVNMVLFEDEMGGNVMEVAEIASFCRNVGIAEVRLYTLSDHKHFDSFTDSYVFWDQDLIEGVSDALEFRTSQLRLTFQRDVRNFIQNFSHSVYPKAEFHFTASGLNFALEPMMAERFNEIDNGVGQEGPYAIRLAADGSIRTQLHTTSELNPLNLLRSGADLADLTDSFVEARDSFPTFTE